MSRYTTVPASLGHCWLSLCSEIRTSAYLYIDLCEIEARDRPDPYNVVVSACELLAASHDFVKSCITQQWNIALQETRYSAKTSGRR
jgi:hypothetical protein